jgi:hypothetical protein
VPNDGEVEGGDMYVNLTNMQFNPLLLFSSLFSLVDHSAQSSDILYPYPHFGAYENGKKILYVILFEYQYPHISYFIFIFYVF